MRVYIWGTGYWAERCMEDILPDVDVLGFVESHPAKKSFKGKKVFTGDDFLRGGDDYDYLIMANSHENEIINEFSLDEKRVVYYLLSIDEGDDGRILYKRKNSEMLKNHLFYSQKKIDIVDKARKVMPCVSVESDGLKFLFNHNDNLIANDMIACGVTYAKREMEFFYNLAPEIKNGYFFEIGANVGTTSIYFRKKLADKLKYICFEPLSENAKYLKMNCILNDCEDITVVNKGLSNKNGKRNMYVFDGAYGSSMISDVKAATSTTADFMKLDDYVEQNAISPKDIAYIWADVQEHELEVVEGGLETLKNSPAGLYIEFNIENYKHTEGKIKKFIDILSGIYNKFVVYEQYIMGENRIRDIEELHLIENEISLDFCNILFLK